MMEGMADIAVHSMKDVPYELPQDFEIGAILERENPFDAFISNNFDSIEALPIGARVGSCSLRRIVQLKALRPDLVILDLRGNVNTRLKKLDDGDYDGSGDDVDDDGDADADDGDDGDHGVGDGVGDGVAAGVADGAAATIVRWHSCSIT